MNENVKKAFDDLVPEMVEALEMCTKAEQQALNLTINASHQTDLQKSYENGIRVLTKWYILFGQSDQARTERTDAKR